MNPSDDISPFESSQPAKTDVDTKHPDAVPLTRIEPSEALVLRQESQQLAIELVRRVPNNPDALEVKARFHLLFGESESAKQCWLEAIQLVPTYAYALHGLGRVSMLNSDYQQALFFLNKSIESQPSNVEAVHDLADAYTKQGAIDQAISTLEQLAERNQTSVQTLVLLGQAYVATSRYEKAETMFRNAIQRSPGKTRAEQGLATVLLRLGKRDEARRLLADQQAVRAAANRILTEQELLDKEKGECSTRFQMAAQVYLGIGDTAQAERIAIRSVDLDPKSPDARALLFSIFRKQGKTTEAIQLARETCTLIPNNPDWHFTLGVLLAQNGDLDVAAAAFREVIRLAPKSHLGYESLARLSLRIGKNFGESILVARKLVEVRGTAADHELLAQAYAINSDFTQAYQSLSEAIRLDSSNKNYAEAMNLLRRAMVTADEKDKE